MKNIFEEIVEANTRNQFIREGEYLLEVTKVEQIQGFKGRSVVIEMLVQESEGENANPSGTKVSTVYNFTKQPDTAPKNARAFFQAVADGQRIELTKEVVEEWLSRANPLRGTLVRAKGKPHVRKDGATVTVIDWYPGPAPAPAPARDRLLPF